MQQKRPQGPSERPQLDEAAQVAQMPDYTRNEVQKACTEAKTCIMQKQPKHHGRWLTVQPYTRKSYRRRCSVCGQVAYMIGEVYTFCPWCGEKMEKEGKQ